MDLGNNMRVVERDGHFLLHNQSLGIETAMTQTALWWPGLSGEPEYDPTTDVWTVRRPRSTDR